MLSGKIRAKSILVALCAQIDGMSNYAVTEENWSTCTVLCNLLESFAEVTHNQSGQNYVSISMTIRVFHMLLNHVKEFIQNKFNQVNWRFIATTTRRIEALMLLKS